MDIEEESKINDFGSIYKQASTITFISALLVVLAYSYMLGRFSIANSIYFSLLNFSDVIANAVSTVAPFLLGAILAFSIHNFHPKKNSSESSNNSFRPKSAPIGIISAVLLILLIINIKSYGEFMLLIFMLSIIGISIILAVEISLNKNKNKEVKFGNGFAIILLLAMVFPYFFGKLSINRDFQNISQSSLILYSEKSSTKIVAMARFEGGIVAFNGKHIFVINKEDLINISDVGNGWPIDQYSPSEFLVRKYRH